MSAEQLCELICLLDQRVSPYFVTHIQSRTTLPGELVEGNWQADLLTAPVVIDPNTYEQAGFSHAFFHQNAKALQKTFVLTQRQAQDIIAFCPDCQCHNFASVTTGVNPRGLRSLDIWQTDVKHFPEFGHTKYVHVSVDTCFGAVHASCHTSKN